MRRSLVKYALAVLVLAAFAFAGCQRIPLYERTANVRLFLNLEMNIDHVPQMTYPTEFDEDYSVKIFGKMPQYVEALFYDAETHRLVTSQILPAEGGFVNVPVGEYSMVVYSFGTESTQVEGTGHMYEIEAFTTDVTKQMASKLSWVSANADSTKSETRGYEDDCIIYEPDHLYVANKDIITVPSFEDKAEIVSIHAEASTIVEVYSLEVLGVKGTENIQSVEAFITGQIKSNYFGKQERNDTPATIYTDMRVDVQNERLYSIFGTFGKQPGHENKIYLDITVTDSDGGQYRYIFDVTEQFDDPENINNTLIIDATEIIDIPDAAHGGGGLAPSVDPWENENIDIPLG